MENETDILKKYVKNLPQGMRDFLAKNTWPQKLELIAQMNKLTEDQTSDLSTEVMLVLAGIENHSDLVSNLQKNILGLNAEASKTLASDVDTTVFSEIMPLLAEIEKNNNESEPAENDENLSKEKVLNDIENPTETKPIVPIKVNPAGANPILDAQHNLPEGEKKVMISSAAVPSRGPMLNNFKSNFGTNPIPSVARVIPTTPVTPPSTNSGPIIKTSSNRYSPPTPKQYGVDPYKEPAE